eukprot:m.239655 g.239655  ORF g.239655 m.239655 type:complete len:69 (-) comp13960_c0_seq1:148-354(-)
MNPMCSPNFTLRCSTAFPAVSTPSKCVTVPAKDAVIELHHHAIAAEFKRRITPRRHKEDAEQFNERMR